MTNEPDRQTKTDEELVALTLQDREIFGVIIRRYEERLKRYIRSISNCSAEDAEDLLQESFIKAYRNLNAFDQKQKFSSWMYRIVHNEVISNYRKLNARAEGHVHDVSEKVFTGLMSDLDIRKDAERNELRSDICKVLDKMDVKYREVLILKFLEEKEYKEISYILRKPMGTIATLINRAKKQFRKTADEMGINLQTL